MEEKNMKKYLLKVQFLMIKMNLVQENIFFLKLFGYDGINFSIKGRNEEVKYNKKIKKTDFPWFW